MNEEPYKSRKIPDHWRNAQKRIVSGNIVAISGLRLKKRGTKLIYPRTRALTKNEIAELTATDEQLSELGNDVNSVLYIGFFEVKAGGIVGVGDSVVIGERLIGSVVGFSDVHYPNHLNIIVKCDECFAQDFMSKSADRSIVKLDVDLEDTVSFGRAV